MMSDVDVAATVDGSSSGPPDAGVKDVKAADKKTYSGKRFDEVDHFVNKDEQFLFCKYWAPVKDPRGLILIVHGYGEHCQRHEKVASLFNELGLYVFSHDHVGHGESEGYRCDITNYRIYLRDLLQHVELIKSRYPGLPLCLYGHSMGGALSVLLAHENPDLFKAVILSAPVITRPAGTRSSINMFFAQHLSTLLPYFPTKKLDTNQISQSKEEVQRYNNDPLVCHDAVHLRMVCQLVAICDDVKEILPEVQFSYLLLHGDDDGICDIAGSKELYEKSKSSDKKFKVFNHGRHELVHESEGIPEQFLATIKEWLEERLV